MFRFSAGNTIVLLFALGALSVPAGALIFRKFFKSVTIEGESAVYTSKVNDVPLLPFGSGAKGPPDAVEKHRPGSPEAVEELKKALSTVIRKNFNKSTFVNADGTPFQFGKPQLKFDEEVYLELIYLYELRRMLPYLGNGKEEHLKEQVRRAETEIQLNGELKFDLGTKHPYITSYTQWYALLAYALRDARRADGLESWKTGGKVDLLLNDLVKHTGTWHANGLGRDKFDGSVACAALYTSLYLYVNTDLARGNVGDLLGTPFNTPPEDNHEYPVKTRRFVKLLENICGKIQNVNYPEFPDGIPATQRFRYIKDPAEPNGNPNLAGGKALYFLAKGFLEYEMRTGPDDKVRMKKLDDYRKLARLTIWNFKEEITNPQVSYVIDTYGLAYMMRAVTIYVRSYANDKDATYSLEMVNWAQEILNTAKSRSSSQFSLYYGPLTQLQFLAEMGHSSDLLK